MGRDESALADGERVRIVHGDSREVLKTLPAESIDAVVTDPPYALVSIVKRLGSPTAKAFKGDVYRRSGAGFMGQTWDTGETAFDPDFWREVLRVLKPGGWCVAASGTRTYHRLACAVEDAGFEIRDMVSWLYGSGFPKSHDVSKGIDKAKGLERKVVGHARHRDIRNGHGRSHGEGINAAARIDGPTYLDHPLTEAASPEAASPEAASPEAAAWTGWGTALKPACEPWVLARKPLIGTVAANVLAHGTGALNIDGCRIEGAKTPAPVGVFRGSDVGAAGLRGERDGSSDHLGRWPANVVHDGSDEVVAGFPMAPGQMAPVGPQHGARTSVNVYGDYGARDQFNPRGDSGSAARFFYSAKADAEDRLGSKHPTVKPVDLMAWLCRLVTPPGGVVLDPFAGSGSTGVAALSEGFAAVLIEREAGYVEDIKRRIAWVRGEGGLTAQEVGRGRFDAAQAAGADTPLFGGLDD